MSRTVDNRVVELEFDNKQFESGVKQSMSTLKNLDTNLDKIANSNAFGDLTKAIKGVDFSSMIDGVQSISGRFTDMGIIAMTALQNITDKAVDTGLRIGKSLTIDQVKSGADKYEQMTQAVQTMKSALQDMSVDQIYEQLELLNWYTDETSYNLTDMVSTISSFTSAGRPLGESIDAIIGISNAAGLAGAGIQNASHAMTGFAKAIGRGSMGSQEWSWIHTARLDTAQLMQSFIDTAIEMGTLSKAGEQAGRQIGKIGKETVSIQNFNSALSEGWLTADVMVKALSGYGGIVKDMYDVYQETGKSATDQLAEMGDAVDSLGARAFRASQEAKTFSEAIGSVKDAVSTRFMEMFQLIFGKYNDARVLWTNVANELYDVFTNPLWAIEDVLTAWENLGHKITPVINDVSKMSQYFESAEEAMEFLWQCIDKGATSMADLNDEFLKELGMSDEAIEKFRKIQDSIDIIDKQIENAGSRHDFLASIGNIWRGLKVIGSSMSIGFSNVFEGIDEFKLQDFVRTFKDLTGRFQEFNEKHSVDFIRAFRGIASIADVVKQIFEGLWRNISEFFPGTVGLIDGMLGFSAAIGDVFTGISKYLKENDSVYKFFSRIKEILRPIAEDISSLLDPIISKFEEFTGINLDEFLDPGNIRKIWTDTGAVMETVSQKISAALDWVEDKVTKVREAFQKIKEGLSPLKVVFNGLKKVLAPVGTLFGNIWESISGVVSGKNISGKGIVTLAAVMLGVKKIFYDFIAEADSWHIGDIIGKIFGKKEDGKIKSIGKELAEALIPIKDALNEFAWNQDYNGLIKFAVAVALIAGSLALVASIDPGRIKQAGIAVGAIMSIMTGLGYAIPVIAAKGKDILRSIGPINQIGGALLKLAASILIIALAMKMLGGLNEDELLNAIYGLVTIVGSIMVLMLMFNIFNGKGKAAGVKNFTKVLKSLIPLAIAVVIFAAAMRFLGGLEDGLVTAILGMVTIVGAISILMLALKKLGTGGKNMIAAGAAMIELGIGMLIIAAAFRLIAGLKLSEAWGNILVLIGAVATLITLMALLTKMKGFNAGSMAVVAASMFILSVAMVVLSAALMALSIVPWDKMWKAAVVLAGLFAVFSIVGGVLAKIPGLAPMLVVVAAAFLVFSAAALVLSAALGITSLALIGFALAFQMMSEVNVVVVGELFVLLIDLVNKLKDAILDLAKHYVKLALFGGALRVIGEGLQAVSVGLIGIALASLIGAAGLFVLAGALDHLTQIGSNVSQGLIKGVMQGVSGVAKVGQFIGKLLTGAVASGAETASPSRATQKVGEFVGMGLENGLLSRLGNIIGIGNMTGEALTGSIEESVAGEDFDGLIANLLGGETIDMSGISDQMTAAGMEIPESLMEGITSGTGEGFDMNSILAQMGMDGESANLAGFDIGSMFGDGFMSGMMGGEGDASGVLIDYEALTAQLDQLNASTEKANQELSSVGASVASASSSLSAPLNNMMLDFEKILDRFKQKFMSFTRFISMEWGHLMNDLRGQNESTFSELMQKATAACEEAITQLQLVYDKVTEIRQGLSEMTDASNLLGGEGTDGGQQATAFVSALVSSIQSMAGDFQAAGIAAGNALANGIKATSSSSISEVAAIVSGAVSELSSMPGEFHSAGVSAGEGAAAGIRSMTGAVAAAARALAQAANSAYRAALRINSPSKVFMESSYSIPEGVAKGIEKKSYMAENAMVRLANTLAESGTSMAQVINDAIESDANPVITPVLDLTSIRKNANAIDGLLGANSTRSLAANITADNAGFGSNIQNGTNSNGNTFNNTTNIYPREMDKATMDYVINAVNRRLGARV